MRRPSGRKTVRDAFLDPEYGPAPESETLAWEWLESGARTFGNYVGGEWIPGQGKLRETRCPADGRLLATFRQGAESDVESAVGAAAQALARWRAIGGHARARRLYRLARQLQKRSRLFAVVESLDNGKPLRESRDIDVPLAARHFLHHAGWAQTLAEEFPGYEPVGVVGQIIPWNFPLLMLAWKVAPALAAGNTVVLKPAEQTPLTALLFAEMAERADIPPGVLNVVAGDGETGAALARHPGIAKVAFTGSTEVGREIRRATAGTGKSLSLELGGKSPFVVFESADLDAAVEGAVDGIWFNQGEVCCAGSRLLVQESVEGEMLSRLRARMARIRVGHPLDKAIDMGALVDRSRLDRVRGYLDAGRRDGAEIWQPPIRMPAGGVFLPPTLCTGCPPSSPLVTEEVFGPVLVCTSFRTPREAVELANDTRYGLAASIWTEDLSLALEVAPRIKAGTVWVNCTNRFDAAAGFGGYRESGFGREGGREGMWEYLRPAARGSRPATRRPRPAPAEDRTTPLAHRPADRLDRTRKLWIGGRQVRPDGGHALLLGRSGGADAVETPRANRKDARNAVEAAAMSRAPWAATSGHERAQILYFVAENLDARSEEFAGELQLATGRDAGSARGEVEAAVRALFTYAARADKHDGRVHSTPYPNVTIAMNEPVGTIAIRAADRAPLAGVIGPVAAALSQGNVAVALLPEGDPSSGLDLVQVLETSDIPGGVVNVLSGLHREVMPTLAAHDDVDQLWDFVADELSGEAERLSAGNLKRCWVDREAAVDWLHPSERDSGIVLRHATQVKNIWIPYGV